MGNVTYIHASEAGKANDPQPYWLAISYSTLSKDRGWIGIAWDLTGQFGSPRGKAPSMDYLWGFHYDEANERMIITFRSEEDRDLARILIPY